jgi:hypothetical protein
VGPGPPDQLDAASANRKRVELRAKLESIRVDLGAWVGDAAEGRPLQKHNSQLRRIRATLEPFLTRVGADIEGADILAEWRRLERDVLDLHAVWGFFRERLAARYVPHLRPYLVAADEFAWACYQPAQEAAVRGGAVPADAVREPPLVALATAAAPYSLVRGDAFGAELDPGAVTATAVALARRLPVPVIGVPWFQLRHLPDLLVVAHEVGHVVFADFGLREQAGDALADALVAAGAVQAEVSAWSGWLEESFADVYGALCAGSAFADALRDFLVVDGSPLEAAGNAAYPPVAERIALARAAAGAAVGGAAGLVAAALRDTAYDGLGRHPLGAIVAPPPDDDVAREGERIPTNYAITTDDIRTLVAATGRAFTRDPEKTTAATRKVLDRAVKIQAPGTRFTGGGESGATLGAREAADRRRAEELYARLRGG